MFLNTMRCDINWGSHFGITIHVTSLDDNVHDVLYYQSTDHMGHTGRYFIGEIKILSLGKISNVYIQYARIVVFIIPRHIGLKVTL